MDEYLQAIAELNKDKISDFALFEEFARQISNDAEFVLAQNNVLAEIQNDFNQRLGKSMVLDHVQKALKLQESEGDSE